VLLASSLPLFVGGLLSDAAYSSTYEVQWINFAAWLIAGALVLAGLAVLFALVEVLRSAQRRAGISVLYLVLLLGTFAVGFIDALVHGKDAWATMPEGLILSALVTVLAASAVWLGFSTLRSGDVR